MSNSSEFASKGCVAVINLLVSLIILIILVATLSPSFIRLPPWVQNLKKDNLISRRQVKGPILASEIEGGTEGKVLVLNALYSSIPLKKILRNKSPESNSSLILSYQESNTAEKIWEKALENIGPASARFFRMESDYKHFYVLDGSVLKAWRKVDGQELWRYDLGFDYPRICEACLNISLDFGVLSILTPENMLYTLNVKNGALLWKQEIRGDTQNQIGFQVYRKQLMIMNEGPPNNTPFYEVYDLLQGSLNLKEPLKEIKSAPNVISSANAFYFFASPNSQEVFLHKKDIRASSSDWKLTLNAESQLPSLQAYQEAHQKEWWQENSRFIYLNNQLGGGDMQVLEIEKESGKVQEILYRSDYQLSFIQTQGDVILFHARRLERPSINQIWVFSLRKRKVLWELNLESDQVYMADKAQLEWSARIIGKELYLLEWIEKKKMLIQKFDLAQGSLLKKNSFKLEKENWDGVVWEKNKIWVSAQDLYGIDYQNFLITKNFPN